ncbi:hypothetical protein [Pedobacter sp. SYSU D00535]|uniref:hypothetical protein n=1 Tax=Pedobacter sp. SYSU D00535 TaxID=2810308 RepID=UPI001A96C93A|nr:hypothetical protein [Pedobacter sp. SYSU D00535]
MRLALFKFIVYILLTYPAFAQQRFEPKQLVEVEWKGKWYKARILEVQGNHYKIHYEGYAASWDETVPASRIRIADQKGKPREAASAQASVRFGKYGCTASKYSDGSYTYIPKGSFQLNKNGTYAYNGFSKASTGTFSVDASGVISFRQGYFNGGQATPIQGYDNRYYLVFPTIPDGRWTCSLITAE